MALLAFVVVQLGGCSFFSGAAAFPRVSAAASALCVHQQIGKRNPSICQLCWHVLCTRRHE